MGHLDALAARWGAASPVTLVADGVAIDGAGWLDRARRAAGWLRARGAGPGDRLFVQTGKEALFAELHLGALALGVSTVPFNPRGTLDEAAFVVADAGPRVVVSDLGLPGAVGVAEARDAVGNAAPASLPGIDAPGGPGEDAEALLLYTSGTTGRPKGAVHGHAQLTAMVEALQAAWSLAPSDVLVHALPLFHVHGLIVAQHLAWWAGATTVWLERFDVSGVVEAVRRHAATVYMGVPTHHVRLARDAPDGALGSLRLVTSGSAPLPVEVHEAFARRFGHRIVERYGMTETGIVTSNPVDGRCKAGTVGLPLPGAALRVVDPETIEDRPAGEVGEVWVRARTLFRGYLGRPAATQAALHEGWMRTGDLGHLDDDGFLVLRGRRSELILCGGFNVYPREVEDALDALDGVEASAVLGVSDPELGEVPVAFVVWAPDAVLDVDAVRARLRARLSAYKIPQDLFAVDALPRNAMGKVDKPALRARLEHPTVTDATPADAGRIAAWNVAMAAETEELALDPAVAARGAARVFERTDARYLVARVLDRPVGQLMLTTEWSDWRDAEIWWIQSVYVHPAWRRRGVWSALYAHVLAEAERAGVAGIRLYVDARNDAARAVYDRSDLRADHYVLYERMLA